jgi:5,10-methylenetetrahydrofolate reductase
MKRVGPMKIPVIAEIILIRTAGMGLFLNKHVKPGMVPNHIIEKLAKAPDKEKTSIEIVSDLVKGLRGLCQGVHFIPMGAEDRLAKYLDAATLWYH